MRARCGRIIGSGSARYGFAARLERFSAPVAAASAPDTDMTRWRRRRRAGRRRRDGFVEAEIFNGERGGDDGRPGWGPVGRAGKTVAQVCGGWSGGGGDCGGVAILLSLQQAEADDERRDRAGGLRGKRRAIRCLTGPCGRGLRRNWNSRRT